MIQKHLSNDDDIDVGKVGDEVIELESEYIENHYQLKFEFGYWFGPILRERELKFDYDEASGISSSLD